MLLPLSPLSVGVEPNVRSRKHLVVHSKREANTVLGMLLWTLLPLKPAILPVPSQPVLPVPPMLPPPPLLLQPAAVGGLPLARLPGPSASV
jgi:hypothetical protein